MLTMIIRSMYHAYHVPRHPSATYLPPQVSTPLLLAPPQVIIRSTAKAAGHVWLREHLRSNYTAAWHEVLALTNPNPKLPPHTPHPQLPPPSTLPSPPARCWRVARSTRRYRLHLNTALT